MPGTCCTTISINSRGRGTPDCIRPPASPPCVVSASRDPQDHLLAEHAHEGLGILVALLLKRPPMPPSGIMTFMPAGAIACKFGAATACSAASKRPTLRCDAYAAVSECATPKPIFEASVRKTLAKNTRVYGCVFWRFLPARGRVTHCECSCVIARVLWQARAISPPRETPQPSCAPFAIFETPQRSVK